MKNSITRKWKAQKNYLFRGDQKYSVCIPNPEADPSLVRHILYLEGPGRETPYLSTSENQEHAAKFSSGAVWKTTVPEALKEKVAHISNSELISLLQGNGKGKASWTDSYEVMQARRYVEQWGEHLLNFQGIAQPDTVARKIFKK